MVSWRSRSARLAPASVRENLRRDTRGTMEGEGKERRGVHCNRETLRKGESSNRCVYMYWVCVCVEVTDRQTDKQTGRE